MKNTFRCIAASYLLILLGNSCKSENRTSANPFTTLVSKDSIQLIKCRKDTNQSYTILLPPDYKPDRKWPVIFAFDPHGDGHLPIRKMRDPASQLGFILIASENFRNGVTNVAGIAGVMFEDAMARYSIDQKRVYLAGFSGGARAAGSLALSGKGIRGIILSGAGQSGFGPANKNAGLVVYGIAGLGDFNRSEIQNMDKELATLQIPHSISFFIGKHEWPPEDEFDQALLWLQIQAMREKLCPVNQGELNWFEKSSDSIAGNLVKSGKMVLAATVLQKAVSALKGLIPVDELEKNLAAIMASGSYLTEVKNEENLAGMEDRLKSEYNNAMLVNDDKWWANELKVINDRCITEKDPLKLGMFNRLKGFFGIMAYSYTSRAVQAGDVKESQRLIAIYSLIEPENPDWIYYQALLYDKMGNTRQAIEELKLSISKGLGDKPRIARDFSSEVRKAVE